MVIDAATPDAADPTVVAGVRATLGRIMGQLGADPVHVAAWSSLPSVAHLSVLRAALDGLADPQVDAVLVDCGPLARARELVEAPAILVRLLDAALTPRLAMWRAPGETAPESAATVFEALSDVRNELLRMHRALGHQDTLMRLVSTAEEESVSRTLDAVTTFALLGVAVDGVVVSRFGDEQAGQVTRMRERLDGVAVWTSAAAARPAPQGLSPLDRVSHAAAVSDESMTLAELDDEYALGIPLVGPGRSRARVGRLGDDLVVAIDDVYRWLPLPPVLRRCRAVGARRTTGGLDVRFAPEPGQWRRPQGSAE